MASSDTIMTIHSSLLEMVLVKQREPEPLSYLWPCLRDQLKDDLGLMFPCCEGRVDNQQSIISLGGTLYMVEMVYVISSWFKHLTAFEAGP